MNYPMNFVHIYIFFENEFCTYSFGREIFIEKMVSRLFVCFFFFFENEFRTYSFGREILIENTYSFVQ